MLTYRKSSNINLQISKTVARAIVEFAKANNVKVIVFENLKGWKAKAGKKGSLQKQKFHLWCHRKIVELVTNRGSCPILVIKTETRFKAEGRGQKAEGKKK